jgi:predicted DNA-binding transcriptional regulator AlpA
MSDITIERKPWLLFSVSRTTWWRWEKDGLVPKGIQLGPNTKGWRMSDLEKCLEDKQGPSS